MSLANSCRSGGSTLSFPAATRLRSGSEGIFRANNEYLGLADDAIHERIAIFHPAMEFGRRVDRWVDLAPEPALRFFGELHDARIPYIFADQHEVDVARR